MSAPRWTATVAADVMLPEGADGVLVRCESDAWPQFVRVESQGGYGGAVAGWLREIGDRFHGAARSFGAVVGSVPQPQQTRTAWPVREAQVPRDRRDDIKPTIEPGQRIDGRGSMFSRRRRGSTVVGAESFLCLFPLHSHPRG